MKKSRLVDKTKRLFVCPWTPLAGRPPKERSRPRLDSLPRQAGKVKPAGHKKPGEVKAGPIPREARQRPLLRERRAFSGWGGSPQEAAKGPEGPQATDPARRVKAGPIPREARSPWP